MLLRLLRSTSRRTARRSASSCCCSSSAPSRRSTCPASTPTSSTTACVTGDTGYIVRTGAVMLGVALVQIVCSVGAVWFGARTAMGFGRDVRAALFHRVGTFSQREVQHFGAPSLITRSTNDVQQVQMLVLMACTMMVAAPIMMVGGVLMAMREDLGLSWLLAVVRAGARSSRSASSSAGWCPSFRLMQARIDEVNRVLREQITGIRVVRAFVREPARDRALRAAPTTTSPTSRVRAGRWLADDVPDRDAGR